jgi:tRNA(Leu) C34 or U34 (ribose-2'-O)-methylase TrmL
MTKEQFDKNESVQKIIESDSVPELEELWDNVSTIFTPTEKEILEKNVFFGQEKYNEIAKTLKTDKKNVEQIKQEALYKLLVFLVNEKTAKTTNFAESIAGYQKRLQDTEEPEVEKIANNLQRIELLFDCLRSPYDIAHIIQIALALDCQIYTSGNCIPFDHYKIKNKVKSWNISNYPDFKHYESFEEAITTLRNQGKYIVGTSGEAKTSYYDLDFSDKQPIIVFGTESTGLSQIKQKMMDELVKMPMKKDVDFLTLPVVVSAIAYDLHKQLDIKNKEDF